MSGRNIERLKEIRDCVDKFGIKETAFYFEMSEESVKRRLRDLRKYKEGLHTSPRKRRHKPQTRGASPILILPDLHAPYHHPDALEFLAWVHETRGCADRVVSVGDLYDFHSMSRHISETDAMNAEKEYAKAMEFVSDLTDLFPEGDLVLGNHDLIPQRQMKELGLISTLLKESNEMYGLPEGWSIHPHYHVIEPFDVLVEHGMGSSGKYGCSNTAINKRCSYVQGHTHSAAAVIYHQNHNSLIFGMNVGCLVDSSSLAMRYGKYGTRKGVLGCGVVYSGEHAEFIPMSSWKNSEG